MPRFLLCDNGVFSTLSYAENAVLQLRAERIARATRPFLPAVIAFVAANAVFCQRNYVLFDNYPSTSKKSLLFADVRPEPMKPSNTGRLIADILPDTLRFNGRVPNPR